MANKNILPIQKYKYWWYDKNLKKKIRDNNFKNFENKIKKLYNIKNCRLEDCCEYVNIKYCIKTNNSTSLIQIYGILGNIFSTLKHLL